MKKLLALLLVLAICLTVVACTDPNANDTSSSAESSSAPTESSVASTESSAEPAESSVAPAESSVAPAESSAAPAESSAAPAESSNSEESSEDTTSQEEQTIPEFISNFVSSNAISTALRATDPASIRLTAVNKSAGYGDVVIFTHDYELDYVTVKNDAYTDFAYLVAEYNHDYFGCVKEKVYAVGEFDGKTSLEIPDDGFVIVAHKAQETTITKFASIDPEKPLFAAGVQVCDVGFEALETATPITIDGVIDDEWMLYNIDSIDIDNEKWTYSNFAKDNYYVTADYYVTFDKDYLYLAVVVNSPFHHCPVTESTANTMWKYECIQVKVASVDPKGDYIAQHYDHVIDGTANNEGKVRAYGFAVNNEGVTCYYENSPLCSTFGGKAVCVRDDTAQTTTYEVAFPWAEFDVDVYELENVGLTFSVNSTNADDVAKGTWRNLILRDGGGVIGRNDWAKIPSVDLEFLDD